MDPRLTDLGNRRLTFKCAQCGNLTREEEMMSGICPRAGSCRKCGGETSRFYPEPKKLRKGGRWVGWGGRKFRTFEESRACKHPSGSTEVRENRFGQKHGYCSLCDCSFLPAPEVT